MRDRPRDVRDGRREADEQADGDDERHDEEGVLDGGLSSRHADTLRRKPSRVALHSVVWATVRAVAT